MPNKSYTPLRFPALSLCVRVGVVSLRRDHISTLGPNSNVKACAKRVEMRNLGVTFRFYYQHFEEEVKIDSNGKMLAMTGGTAFLVLTQKPKPQKNPKPLKPSDLNPDPKP